MAWFAVRSIIRFAELGVYEERIVLFNVADADIAIQRAYDEAIEYVDGDSTAEVLKFGQSYELFDDEVGDSTEVFSLMRTSALDPETYLSTFFDTGEEYQRTEEWGS